MPTYLKFAISFCAEVFFIILGGVAGAWLVVRDIPAGEDGGPGDGIGVVLFGGLGMIIAGMVGIVALVISWSALAMKREAGAGRTTGAESAASGAGSVWPPPPQY